jgi:hypothetical protein
VRCSRHGHYTSCRILPDENCNSLNILSRAFISGYLGSEARLRNLLTPSTVQVKYPGLEGYSYVFLHSVAWDQHHGLSMRASLIYKRGYSTAAVVDRSYPLSI